MYDMGVSYTFHNFTESFLRNGVLILSGKDNKKAGTIYLEIRIPKKKNKKLLTLNDAGFLVI